MNDYLLIKFIDIHKWINSEKEELSMLLDQCLEVSRPQEIVHLTKHFLRNVKLGKKNICHHHGSSLEARYQLHAVDCWLLTR